MKSKPVKHVSPAVLKRVVDSINRQFKKGREEDDELTATTFGDSVFSRPKAYIPSGILPVDCIVCKGKGWPTGIVEIFGNEGTGKTALLEHTIAAAQRRGYYTAIFPMEYSLDDERIRRVGVDVERLLILDAETIEDIYDQMRSVTRAIRKEDKETPIVFGWDSIAATPTRSEMEDKKGKGIESAEMGVFARQASKLFKRMVRFLSKNKVCLICINQTRANIGNPYGPKETTPGGKALRFYAWVRARISVKNAIKDKEDRRIGMMCELECVKNKVAPPFRKCTFPLLYTGSNAGIDADASIFEYGIDLGVFEKAGTKYSYEGQVVSRKKFASFYRKHRKEINKKIKLAAKELAEGL